MNTDLSGIAGFEGDESGIGDLALDGSGAMPPPDPTGFLTMWGGALTIYGAIVTIYGDVITNRIPVTLYGQTVQIFGA